MKKAQVVLDRLVAEQDQVPEDSRIKQEGEAEASEGDESVTEDSEVIQLDTQGASLDKHCFMNKENGEDETVNQVRDLQRRVGELEDEVEDLRSELRLMKRKMRSFDPKGEELDEVLERKILRVLGDHCHNVSKHLLREALERHRSDSGGRHERARPAPRTAATRSKRYFPEKKQSAVKYYNSDEDFEGGGGDDDDYRDPSYAYEGYESDTENIRPNPAILRAHKAGKAKPPRRVEITTGVQDIKRKIIVTKKVQLEQPTVPDEERALGLENPLPHSSASKDNTDTMISAGDVSVILDEEDKEEPKKKRPRSREYKPRPPVQCSNVWDSVPSAMESSHKKRRAFTLQEKVEIIELIENGNTQEKICSSRNLQRSTVNGFWKRRLDLKKRILKSNPTLKKTRSGTFENIDTALFQWFREQRDAGLPLSGPLLKERAKLFAESLGVENFGASNGWLTGWKRRFKFQDLQPQTPITSSESSSS